MFPTCFLSHGGGPWPYLQGPMRASHGSLEEALRELRRQLPRPAAVLMVSSHWEAPGFILQCCTRPPMLYDYAGFPPHTYEVLYPAPGSPALVEAVRRRLLAADIPCGMSLDRGFDHGAFVPLSLLYPQADVPVVQLSLQDTLDPATHLALGRALAPLREQDVFIIGSGASYHNLGLRPPEATVASERFDAWLQDTLLRTSPAERCRRLTRWHEAPGARQAHPREEHLLPLMVVAGAAQDDAGTCIYHEDRYFGAVALSSFRFG